MQTPPNAPDTGGADGPSAVSATLARNIEALRRRKALEDSAANADQRFAERITRFTGSLRFVYLHLVAFGAWIVVNLGLVPGVPRFDPSFVKLAMAASVEAIFLSTFVLITQNRMADAASRRADLDLQINLLAEHEITRLAGLIAAIAERVGVEARDDPEIDEIKRDVAPETILDQLDADGSG